MSENRIGGLRAESPAKTVVQRSLVFATFVGLPAGFVMGSMQKPYVPGNTLRATAIVTSNFWVCSAVGFATYEALLKGVPAIAPSLRERPDFERGCSVAAGFLSGGFIHAMWNRRARGSTLTAALGFAATGLALHELNL